MKIAILPAPDICYNTLNYFLDSIESGLNYWGVQTRKLYTESDVLSETWDAVVGINNPLPSEKFDDGSFVADAFQCPVFNILVDPPYYHHFLLESHMNNLYIILLDQGHVTYCRKYYPPFQNVEMAYLPGPSGKYTAYESREIDVLFTCSLPDKDNIKTELSRACSLDWIGSLFDSMIKNGIERPDMSTLLSLKSLLSQNNLQCSDYELKLLMNLVGTYSEFYLRGYYRQKILTTLVDAGLHVHVAGNGWENLYPSCPDNLVIKGPLSFLQTADLTANAKISVNVMPWFKDGIHDRVLTAMLNGAVCVTDSSSYIGSHFRDKEELMLYSLKDTDSLPSMIDELLRNPAVAENIARAGQDKVNSHYTWELFAKKYILEHLFS